MKEYLSNQEFKWVDTHCHLQLAKHEFNELDFSNIEYLIIPGVDSKSSIKARELDFQYIVYEDKKYSIDLISEFDAIFFNETTV